MASASTSTAYINPLNVSFDDPSPVPWPATFALTSIGDYPFGPPQTDSIEAYVERRYLECLWMPEVLEPLSSFIPSLRRVTPPKDWTAGSGPHPLHVVLDEHLLNLVDIHKKYRKTIPALLEKEGDAQDPEEACIWYAWTHAQPLDEEQKGDGVNEEKWAKEWLHEAEKREYLVQILLRMLKLTLPPPPAPKRKRRKNKEEEEDASPYAETIAGLEMLVDRIGIIRQTASSNLTKDKDKALGKLKETDRDWAAVFCEDVLKPLFEESLPEHYETVRYHCLPAPSREPSPAPSASSLVDISESQPPSQPHTSRSLSRATSISSRAGSLKARSISRSSVSHDLRQSQSQSRSRSGSVEADPILDRSRTRSVSFAARSAGGIRATMPRPGVRPKGGKSKLKQVNSASGVGLGKPARIAAPEPVRAQTTGPTLLVAETPQKPSRTMSREVSVTGASLMQRFQGSQSLARAQSQRNVSMDKSALEEFMVSSPERLKDDFNFGDMVLETPRK